VSGGQNIGLSLFLDHRQRHAASSVYSALPIILDIYMLEGSLCSLKQRREFTYRKKTTTNKQKEKEKKRNAIA
jgi:hypothetical protein